ncbi:MAG: hypothetical protein COB49_02055 [Alphaproteobacteria bacterium]|nr:MAG: hypothetical protein COB49_02055 [Alphaproteobacteria bacterium]
MNDLNFGDEVKDTVSGFAGKVTAFAQYATGCSQVLVSPPVTKTGDYRDAQWFDIERILFVKPAKTKIPASPSGGPRGNDAAPTY